MLVHALAHPTPHLCTLIPTVNKTSSNTGTGRSVNGLVGGLNNGGEGYSTVKDGVQSLYSLMTPTRSSQSQGHGLMYCKQQLSVYIGQLQ